MERRECLGREGALTLGIEPSEAFRARGPRL